MLAIRTDPNAQAADRIARLTTFCEAIEQGETVRRACEAAGVVWGAIGRWLADDRNVAPHPVTGELETFAARYARARVSSGAFYADKVQETAEAAYDKESAIVGRLRMDAYKWRAAVADPKGYGERQAQAGVTINLGSLHLEALQAPRPATMRVNGGPERELTALPSPDRTE